MKPQPAKMLPLSARMRYALLAMYLGKRMTAVGGDASELLWLVPVAKPAERPPLPLAVEIVDGVKASTGVHVIHAQTLQALELRGLARSIFITQEGREQAQAMLSIHTLKRL